MESRVETLSKYRFESSIEALEDSKLMFKNGRYKSSLNRSYYAIFFAIKSVIILEGFDSSKHSGVIAFFNQTYVKTGVFSKDLSKIIKYLSEGRENADYEDFFFASREDAEIQIERAEYFQNSIKNYLSDRGII